jgi:hypothetical protein
VRVNVVVWPTTIEEAQGRRAARIAGITVCSAHAHLVMRDPLHHPAMRRRERTGGDDAGA